MLKLISRGFAVAFIPVLVAVVIFSQPTWAVAQAPTAAAELANLVGEDIFAKAGLGRLSAQEQVVLSQWLKRQQPSNGSEGSSPVLAEPKASGSGVVAVLGDEQLQSRQPPPLAAAIDSHIVGAFTGWNGSTRFKLKNGQIWQQRVAGRYKVRLESPAVRIKKSRFGYRMVLVDDRGESQRAVGVKRIK